MSHKITDPHQLKSLIRGMREHIIFAAELEIVKQRKIIHNYEALIDVIEATGEYENPTGNETSRQADDRWKKMIGSYYKPFDK